MDYVIMEEECFVCGNILSTMEEIDTGRCSACGHHIDDFSPDAEEELFQTEY